MTKDPNKLMEMILGFGDDNYRYRITSRKRLNLYNAKLFTMLRLVQEFCSSQVSSEDDSDRSEEALYDGLDEELVTWDSF